MAGLEADTSSYNQPMPVSPLDTVKNIAGLQQQKLQIDQAKLDQANQGLTYMTRAMGSLGPNATTDQYIGAAANAVKMGLVPENMLQTFVERAKAAPNSQAFYKEFMTAAADHQQQIAMHIGQNETTQNGSTVYQGVRKPAIEGGGFKPATQMSVQMPPGTPYNEGGQQKLLGPSGPEGVQPAASAPLVPKPVRTMPVERPVTGPTGPTVDRTSEVPTTLANRLEGLNAAPPPMFEEGKKALTEAQLKASGLMQNAKPAIQALKLMKTTYGPDGKYLSTGPGTAQFNDLVALAKAWGVTSTAAENDPTVMRQELEKKLAQFVGTSPIAGRSDAAQTLAEAGSPNPKKQILPALINLTKDTIALNRVEAAKALMFKGSDYAKVGEHMAKFPQTVDERAFSLDLMDTDERDKLVKKMVAQYKTGDSKQKKEADKFLGSLKMSEELGFYE